MMMVTGATTVVVRASFTDDLLKKLLIVLRDIRHFILPFFLSPHHWSIQSLVSTFI